MSAKGWGWDRNDKKIPVVFTFVKGGKDMEAAWGKDHIFGYYEDTDLPNFQGRMFGISQTELFKLVQELSKGLSPLEKMCL